MSVVDAPPGLAFAGRAAGEFVARPASVRLARRCLAVIGLASVIATASIRRRANVPDFLWSGPLVAVSIGLVGYAVRRARLRIDGSGVRWGWDLIGFRMRRERLADAVAYRDAIAFRRAGGGGPWYLARHDFAAYDQIPVALRAAGIRFTIESARAPWRSRLQTYGVALDILLVLDAIFSVLTLLLALGA